MTMGNKERYPGEMIIKLSKKDEKKVVEIANSALDVAIGFMVGVDFINRFNLDGDRALVFQFYFAHYLVLKNGLRSSENTLSKEAAKRLLANAENVAVAKEYGSPCVLRNAANVLTNEVMRWRDDRSKNRPPLSVAMQGPLASIRFS